MLTCPDCKDEWADPDAITHTWQQWQCPGCNSWVDHDINSRAAFNMMPMSKYNVADLMGNLIPDGVVDGSTPVTQRVTPSVGDDPHARMIDLICDMAGTNTKTMPNNADRMIALNQFIDRARDVLNVMEADEVRKKWNEEAPEPEANEGPFCTPRELKTWLDWADTSQPWDMRDEDGDLHSPSWYIEAFTDASNSYGALLSKDTSGMTPAEEVTHMHNLDDALLEMEMYARYVDRLFGVSTKA